MTTAREKRMNDRRKECISVAWQMRTGSKRRCIYGPLPLSLKARRVLESRITLSFLFCFVLIAFFYVAPVLIEFDELIILSNKVTIFIDDLLLDSIVRT